MLYADMVRITLQAFFGKVWLNQFRVDISDRWEKKLISVHNGNLLLSVIEYRKPYRPIGNWHTKKLD